MLRLLNYTYRERQRHIERDSKTEINIGKETGSLRLGEEVRVGFVISFLKKLKMNLPHGLIIPL